MEITFPFPFKPYDIQEKFMKELYFTLEQQKLGIFESPTGTVSSFFPFLPITYTYVKSKPPKLLW